MKDAILRQAWSQRQILYKTKPIFFDHDYFPELQKKRAQVRHVIKQLKEKNISAKSIYPAQLRISTGDGEKAYSMLTQALPELWELEIQARVDERQRMESKLSHYRWSTAAERRGKDPAVLPALDVSALLGGDE